MNRRKKIIQLVEISKKNQRFIINKKINSNYKIKLDIKYISLFYMINNKKKERDRSLKLISNRFRHCYQACFQMNRAMTTKPFVYIYCMNMRE